VPSGSRNALREAAVRLLGSARVRDDPATLHLHSYDASLERRVPDLVIRPRDRDELRALVRLAYVHGVPFVLRGAGTGYSGGGCPGRRGTSVGDLRLLHRRVRL